MSRLKVWAIRASIVSVAPTVEVFSRFARTAIMSRLVAPAEFGTAIALITVVATFGLVTDMSFDKFLMARVGDETALGAAHVVSFLRGLVLAAVLIVLAPFTADVFGVPQFAGSFALVGVFPLIQSLAHLKVKQIEGQYNFVPEMSAQVICYLASIIALLVGLVFWRDHRAMLFSMLVQFAAYTLASHFFAQSTYRVRTDAKTIWTLLTFAAPIILNGVGLAVVTMFDRIMVGHWFNVEVLAAYVVLLTLSGVPISLMDRTFGKLALTYLISRLSLEDRPEREAHRAYEALALFFSLLAMGYSLFVAVSFDILIPLVFGSHFSASPLIHALITARVFLLVQMVGAPTRFLIAAGRTPELAFLSLSSAFSLLAAFATMTVTRTIEGVLLGLTVGDAIRMPFHYWVVSRKGGPGGILVALYTGCSSVAVFGVAWLLWSEPQTQWPTRVLVLAAGLVGIAAQGLLGLRTLREEVGIA